MNNPAPGAHVGKNRTARRRRLGFAAVGALVGLVGVVGVGVGASGADVADSVPVTTPDVDRLPKLIAVRDPNASLVTLPDGPPVEVPEAGTTVEEYLHQYGPIPGCGIPHDPSETTIRPDNLPTAEAQNHEDVPVVSGPSGPPIEVPSYDEHGNLICPLPDPGPLPDMPFLGLGPIPDPDHVPSEPPPSGPALEVPDYGQSINAEIPTNLPFLGLGPIPDPRR